MATTFGRRRRHQPSASPPIPVVVVSGMPPGSPPSSSEGAVPVIFSLGVGVGGPTGSRSPSLGGVCGGASSGRGAAPGTGLGPFDGACHAAEEATSWRGTVTAVAARVRHRWSRRESRLRAAPMAALRMPKEAIARCWVRYCLVQPCCAPCSLVADGSGQVSAALRGTCTCDVRGNGKPWLTYLEVTFLGKSWFIHAVKILAIHSICVASRWPSVF
jgi:hypothetical protein